VNHAVLRRVAGTSDGSRTIAQLNEALATAANLFGTPVYVMDMISVATAARQVEAAFGSPWLLHYSLKANDLPALAGYLAGRGWGGAVVSVGEWQHARHGGLSNESVVFEGIGKTDAQLGYAAAEAAAGRPPRWLVIESAEELTCLADLSAGYQLGRAGRPAIDVLLRLNPGVDPETRREFAVGAGTSKFGMPAAEISALAKGAAASFPGLTVRGIHVHVGSALTDVRAWALAGVRATRLLADIAGYCPRADTVDYGGGFPLAGGPGPAQFRDALLDALAAAGLPLPTRPAIEPGRYLVGSAGWLVSRALHVRKPPESSAENARVILDAGMTELMRPALYGSLHRVHALRPGGDELRATVVDGPVCEMTDSFGTHQLPPLARGDLVAIEQAGAYAASFTSRYNGRPHPAETLLWHNGELELCERPVVQATTGGLAERRPSAEGSLV
jgi:diaminopimelate decarboxylase